jgi:hypothetical protein
VRVALLSDSFSRNVGYLENMLPKYLARKHLDVHVLSMDLPPYYWLREFADTFKGFLEELRPGTIEKLEGYTLHILPHKRVGGYMRMVGLGKKLRSIRPDIVQTMTAIGWNPLDAALYKQFFGYELFTGAHMTASVFPLARREVPWWNRERLKCTIFRTVPGRLVSLFTRPREEEELAGLVYSLTRRPDEEPGTARYLRPVPLGVSVLILALILNVIFR